MLPHSDTIFWFRANQFLLFLLNAVCLAEKQKHTYSIIFGLTQSGLEPTIYRTRWAREPLHHRYGFEGWVIVVGNFNIGVGYPGQQYNACDQALLS